MRAKLLELSITIFSLAAVAAINYSIVHSVVVFIALAVLFAHELGHYFMARRCGAQAKLPFFLPLPLLLIAATKVSPTDRSSTRKIAFAGPLVGVLASLLLLVLCIAFNASLHVIASVIILLTTEIVFNFLGSDGKRFRNA